MRVRGSICGLGLLFFLGCQGASPQINPFVPAASPQLPPPPTGTAGRTDPYYQRSMAAAPNGITPNGAAPNGAAAQMSALPSVPTARYLSTDPVNNPAGNAAGSGAGAMPVGTQPAANSGAQLNWNAPAPGSQVVPASGTSSGWQSPPRY